MHREVPVKVTAWVDEGVADLVLALNEIPGIQTLDSCQEDAGHGLASVMFCTRNEAELYATVSRLAGVIGCGPCGGITLSLWWGGDDAPAIADLRCPPERLSAVAGAVRANAARMNL